MMMSTEDCLKMWRPAIFVSLGRDYDRTDLAVENMRRVIDRAKQAEAEGRIKDMQPTFAMVNDCKDKAAEGWFFIEIVYHPVIDGKKGPRERYTKAVLQP